MPRSPSGRDLIVKFLIWISRVTLVLKDIKEREVVISYQPVAGGPDNESLTPQAGPGPTPGPPTLRQSDPARCRAHLCERISDTYAAPAQLCVCTGTGLTSLRV